MAMDVHDVLHTIHTATNNVLAGYATMLVRADPEILPIVKDLSNLHRCHATEQKEALRRLWDTEDGDRTLRATATTAVAKFQDWGAGVDVDALAALHNSEKALLDIYRNTLTQWSVDGHGEIAECLRRQYHEIREQLAKLPTE
ncbi:protein of unknown function [Loktanella atrilutea]|uniref:DUF2383 domain-containing protein n=1 Tax=Loktanella atrilutea TaxID=366533 RepID=A0A1M5G593_LOKAT|nr:DUF2383 domain-containing protein [Loktanella atrilutea]SHF98621.1 protein of unknown function [Loktanella atrilutea]